MLILALHRFHSGPGTSDLDTSPRMLERLVDALGVHLFAPLDSTRHSARDAWAITSDDGNASDLELAEFCAKRGLRLTVFVNPSSIGSPGRLSETDLRQLLTAGHQVGSHGMTHARLSDLSPSKMRYEVADSKALLESILGTSVTLFAYPGGVNNAHSRWQVKNAGYTAAFGVTPLRASAASPRFCLPRLVLTSQMEIPEVRRRIEKRAFSWPEHVLREPLRLLSQVRSAASVPRAES